jgi:hypothetical protein
MVQVWDHPLVNGLESIHTWAGAGVRINPLSDPIEPADLKRQSST